MKYRLLLSLFVSLSALVINADTRADINPKPDLTPWRAQSTEGNQHEKARSSLTSSMPEESQQVAKFAARENQPTANADHIIWVYDADIAVFNDNDGDGYFPTLRVSFDVDTVLSHARIYAVVYLGDAAGYREIHTTSDFDIYIDASDDDFAFTTDLLQGFNSWDYDVLIEIYDVDTHQLQDIYDHSNDSDLSLVSLESNEFEYRQSSTITATYEHGGSMTAGLLAGLLALIVLRRKIHRTKQR